MDEPQSLVCYGLDDACGGDRRLVPEEREELQVVEQLQDAPETPRRPQAGALRFVKHAGEGDLRKVDGKAGQQVVEPMRRGG